MQESSCAVFLMSALSQVAAIAPAPGQAQLEDRYIAGNHDHNHDGRGRCSRSRARTRARWRTG
jgi:hypothetical protein